METTTMKPWKLKIFATMNSKSQFFQQKFQFPLPRIFFRKFPFNLHADDVDDDKSQHREKKDSEWKLKIIVFQKFMVGSLSGFSDYKLKTFSILQFPFAMRLNGSCSGVSLSLNFNFCNNFTTLLQFEDSKAISGWAYRSLSIFVISQV